MKESVMTSGAPITDTDSQINALTAGIVSAFVSNNPVPASELPSLINSVRASLNGATTTAAPAEPEIEKPTPDQIKKSITPDALISFIDGNAYKTLKRHLGTHGLNPETYRQRYGLPADYPMVSPNYSVQRSNLAKQLGLGQQRRNYEAPAEAPVPAAPKRKKADAPKRKKADAKVSEKAAA